MGWRYTSGVCLSILPFIVVFDNFLVQPHTRLPPKMLLNCTFIQAVQ